MIISKIEKTYKIRDPIYGFIKLDAQEMDIVDSPYFQRLRRIKQLSLTDMVYPSANHTRFEHSLGVLQMASDMFDNIISNESNLRKLHLRKEDVGRTRKIIRLAALLHDIGHPPFSHGGEEAMPFFHGRKRLYKHEDYSIAAIKFFYREMIETHPMSEHLGVKAEDITAVLDDESVKITRTALLWKGLISGQLDADRADYLLRDSLHIGVNYGIFDRNRLINCITIGESPEMDCFLAIEHGGWHVAESLVIARYQMFSQVYFHPVRRAFDYHVGQALKETLRRSKFPNSEFPPPTSQRNVSKYLELDDWFMYDAIKNGKAGLHGDIIIKRCPYKCKKEWDGEPDTVEIDSSEEAISKYGGYLDRGATTKWYKLDRDIAIFDEKNNNSYPLSFRSKLIGTMPGLSMVTRLYICQEGDGHYYEFTV